MSALHLKIITPKKVVLEKEILSITLPTEEGEITILPRHANLFAILKEGIVKIKYDGNEDYLAIGGGYLETDGKMVNVLVSRAYGQDEIDEKMIEEAKEQAKKLLEQAKTDDQRQQAVALLRRSLIDSKLIKKRKRSSSVT
jgi:F-type H+-transporting ATPase subunit epsilon